jgi:gentisate 1,2-dioxygenase
MHSGDLILTPNWCWHGHTNDTNESALWIDGLDVPVVQMLRQGIHEDFLENIEPPSCQRVASLNTFGFGHLKPFGTGRATPISPLWSYPWTQTEQALHKLAEVASNPPGLSMHGVPCGVLLI